MLTHLIYLESRLKPKTILTNFKQAAFSSFQNVVLTAKSVTASFTYVSVSLKNSRNPRNACHQIDNGCTCRMPKHVVNSYNVLEESDLSQILTMSRFFVFFSTTLRILG